MGKVMGQGPPGRRTFFATPPKSPPWQLCNPVTGQEKQGAGGGFRDGGYEPNGSSAGVRGQSGSRHPGFFVPAEANSGLKRFCWSAAQGQGYRKSQGRWQQQTA
jgi:hypothetical protein